ncbi:hypothetical protein BDV96DRAFT_596328 [Lophiotrema nucula]|uniref:F-box domain-containing protein n=1 Tax=Lophiotrema nucula TaxID=690887 RepID=A0A6A5ZN42_9PLEO|nr:hypothetical protein BDV96DRAFT_596328 [Lophiotrema nucula]
MTTEFYRRFAPNRPTRRPQPVLRKFTFLELSGEVRNHIYSYCTDDQTVTLVRRPHASNRTGGFVGLGQTCKQVRKEFLPNYVRKVVVRPAEAASYTSRFYPIPKAASRHLGMAKIGNYVGEIVIDLSNLFGCCEETHSLFDALPPARVAYRAPKLKVTLSNTQSQGAYEALSALFQSVATGQCVRSFVDLNDLHSTTRRHHDFDPSTLFSRLEFGASQDSRGPRFTGDITITRQGWNTYIAPDVHAWEGRSITSGVEYYTVEPLSADPEDLGVFDFLAWQNETLEWFGFEELSGWDRLAIQLHLEGFDEADEHVYMYADWFG